MKPLISVADVKALLPIRPANTEFDPRIKLAILAATSQIEDGIGRSFEKSVRYEQFTSRDVQRTGLDIYGNSEDGLLTTTETQTLYLRAIPLDEAAPIEVRYDARQHFDEESIVPASAYSVDFDKGSLALRWGTRYSPRAIRVSYTAGLAASTDEWPNLSASLTGNFEPLKLAAQMQALHLFNKSAPETVGRVNDPTDGKKPNPFQVPGGLIPEVVSLIHRYRRVAVGRG